MAHLALYLLGPFQAALDGMPVQGLNSAHLRGLLAYMAVERGREHLREQVAALLWPERPDREALTALRCALANLRSALGDRRSPDDLHGRVPLLLVTRTSVQLNPVGNTWLDITELEGLAGRTDVPNLERAVSLYRGPFLQGLSVAGSPAFEEWMLFKGEEYQRRILSLLEQLTSLQLGAGATAEAVRWARRQLELEPYRESAHRQLMAALASGGERPAALAHYEACRRLLAGELGCEPDDETQALAAWIRAGAMPPLASRPLLVERSAASPDRMPLGESRELSVSVGAPPAPLVGKAPAERRFVARDQELARLESLLDRALTGQGGMALIAGEAGSGKTALLDELARRACLARGDLIALRGSCNAYGGAGDPYLPFRELLRALAGDVEGARAAGTLLPDQARRAWEALPALGAALAEHGPDLIGTFVPGEALLQRVEGFRAPSVAAAAPVPRTPQSSHLSRAYPVGQHQDWTVSEGGPGARQAWQTRLRALVRRGQQSTTPAPQADLFAQATRVLNSVSLRRPLLLEIDDLQWADRGTAALLFHLGRRLAGSRILLVCACRPEAVQPSPARDLGGIWTVLHELLRQRGNLLVDLDRADGQAFVEAYIDSEPNRLGAAFRRALHDHTEGNPLFTVELLRSFERDGALLLDEGGHWIEAAALDWDRLPPQVEVVIAGHLAGLPDEDRTLLGAASVQGEQFIVEVAAQVSGWDEAAAVRRLGGPLQTRHRLVEAVSLERLPPSGRRLSHYRFRHLLVQRSAYDALDPVEQALLHEATARALEMIYGTGEQAPALTPRLARHYEAAGLPLQAARALHAAGRQAMRLSAFGEALSHFEHGLSLLADAPPSPERIEIEQLLQVARLGPLGPVRGWGSSQLAGSLARAASAGGGGPQGRPKLQMLQANANLLSARGAFEDALAAAGQMLDLATQWGDEAFVAGAHLQFGLLYHLMGEPLKAESHFERTIAQLTPERRADSRAALGLDVVTVATTFSALDQWFLGYPEEALARSTRALTDALEQGNLYGQALASAIGSMTLFLLRSGAAALQERAEFAHGLSMQGGVAWLQAYAEVFLGWLDVLRGDDDAGIETMRGAIGGWQAKGMAIGTDGLVLVLADGCLAAAGRRPPGGAEHAALLAIGLAAIDRVLGPRAPCGQSYQAELQRLRGELLLARDGPATAVEALSCFQTALELAREHGLPSVELRAAMSLVRLQERGQGLRSEAEREGSACSADLAQARQCLAAVVGRFTEGFAFPDLQDAAALLGHHPC